MSVAGARPASDESMFVCLRTVSAGMRDRGVPFRDRGSARGHRCHSLMHEADLVLAPDQMKSVERGLARRVRWDSSGTARCPVGAAPFQTPAGRRHTTMLYASPNTPGAKVAFKPAYDNFIGGKFVPP